MTFFLPFNPAQAHPAAFSLFRTPSGARFPRSRAPWAHRCGRAVALWLAPKLIGGSRQAPASAVALDQEPRP